MSAKKRKERDITGEFLKPAQFAIKDYKLTEKQRELVRLIRDKETKVVFLTGPAGSAKSFIAVFCALLALKEGSKTRLKYIRSLVESSDRKAGFLPGDIHSKLAVYTVPLLDKLDEFLTQYDSTKLLQEKQIECLPPNFLRGTTFKDDFLIVDEVQNFTYKECVTIISRLGENSTIIFAGDLMQSDIRNSGISKLIDIFDDQESRDKGIHTFAFSAEDILRSEILKFIIGKIEKAV